MSGEMVFEVEAWDDGTICRTRAYSGVRLRNTSIPSSSFPFYPCVIYSICGFKTKVLLHWNIFSCKIPSRRSYCNIAMFRLPNSDEMYPMSRRALWPYAEKHLAPVFQRHVPTQQMSHPTPVSLYPPPQSLRLHSFQHSLMLPSGHCSTVYWWVYFGDCWHDNPSCPESVPCPKVGPKRRPTTSCTVLLWDPAERGLTFRCRTSPAGTATTHGGKVSVQHSKGLH